MTPNLLVNVDVPDLERGIAFYTRTFGLQVGRRFGAEAVELVGGNAPIYLLLKEAGTAAIPGTAVGRSFDRHWTPVHLDFAVEDIDASVRNATEAGAKLEQPVATHRWGRIALMADPFGNGFCFLQFLGRGYDEIASR